MEGIIAEVALFGAAQIGLLLFGLGRMWSTQKAHGLELAAQSARISKVEDTQLKIVADVGRLKGEVRA